MQAYLNKMFVNWAKFANPLWSKRYIVTRQNKFLQYNISRTILSKEHYILCCFRNIGVFGIWCIFNISILSV